MKFLKILCIAAVASLLTTACGSKNNSDGNVDYSASSADIDPVDFQHGTDKITAEQLHELILTPDDLKPGQAIGALNYLNTLILQASGQKKDELMREFVDLYGIVAEAHPDDIAESVQRLKNRSGIDLKAIFEDYSLTLRVGDNDGSKNPNEEDITFKTDTIAIVTPGTTPSETPSSVEGEPDAIISTFGE